RPYSLPAFRRLHGCASTPIPELPARWQFSGHRGTWDYGGWARHDADPRRRASVHSGYDVNGNCDEFGSHDDHRGLAGHVAVTVGTQRSFTVAAQYRAVRVSKRQVLTRPGV